MLIYKTGGKVQKFHTFSTVLLFAASGSAFVVAGLDTGFCGRVKVISFEININNNSIVLNININFSVQIIIIIIIVKYFIGIFVDESRLTSQLQTIF